MRTCPNCHTQYTDDTLRYCLQDGTPLVDAPSTQQPTVSFNDRDLATEQHRNVDTSASVETQWAPKTEAAGASHPKRSASSFRFGFGVVIAALAVFLLGALAALGLWLYFGPPSDVAKNSNRGTENWNGSQANSNSTATPTPRVSPSPSPSNTSGNRNTISPTPDPEPTQTPRIDKEQAARQVSQEIRDWIDSSQDGDLEALMSQYATTVDYYRRSGADRAFIRADKQRAFRLYDSITFRISNLNVSVSDSGDTARAVFDKEWLFLGNSQSSGKVQQELRFRRINGEWRITSERDLRVYYSS